MAIKPILFSTPMVHAILDGRKTMTRRVVKLRPCEDAHESDDGLSLHAVLTICGSVYEREIKPQYQPGDILWVRETWAAFKVKKPIWAIPADFKDIQYIYRSDDIRNSDGSAIKWRPSVHMPREAARLFLRVTDVRAEQVQDISDEDATREGIVFTDFGMDANRGEMSIDGGVTFHPIKPEQHNGFHAGGVTRPGQCYGSPRSAFACLWDTLNRKRGFGWGENPWVWVYSFERVYREEAEVSK